MREVYEAVRLAHDRAIQAVAPGRSRFDIDAAARQTLDERGLGEAFGHGTGHGLGIEVHEGPRITRRRPDVDTADEAVQAGMVFTIEPGAYLAGLGRRSHRGRCAGHRKWSGSADHHADRSHRDLI